MTAAEHRRRLIARFNGDVDTTHVTRKDFNLCFPDAEILASFIKVTGLHVHQLPESMGDVTISEHAENPWG
jgi:hypothetical protein